MAVKIFILMDADYYSICNELHVILKVSASCSMLDMSRFFLYFNYKNNLKKFIA